jgi:O-acetyl-ADP-ribose deacetylase (regulator of RNase III)
MAGRQAALIAEPDLPAGPVMRLGGERTVERSRRRTAGQNDMEDPPLRQRSGLGASDPGESVSQPSVFVLENMPIDNHAVIIARGARQAVLESPFPTNLMNRYAMYPVVPRIVTGDLLDQPVEVIVNAWNRNIIPWWLLLPQGVSGAIKRRAGYQPFRELARHGPLPLGGAALTGAGRLDCRAIIHVAGINLLWRASRASIGQSVRSAMAIVNQQGFASAAFPVIGAGTGGFGESGALEIMLAAFAEIESRAEVRIVRYRRG